jgi:hypothetical protein
MQSWQIKARPAPGGKFATVDDGDPGRLAAKYAQLPMILDA